jgi:hypothetical protein
MDGSRSLETYHQAEMTILGVFFISIFNKLTAKYYGHQGHFGVQP